MAAKRKTKQQREAEQEAALRQRITDIAVGSAGYDFDQDGEFAVAGFLSRFIPALKIQFYSEEREYLWSIHNIENFETIDSTVEFLWRNGIRA